MYPDVGVALLLVLVAQNSPVVCATTAVAVQINLGTAARSASAEIPANGQVIAVAPVCAGYVGIAAGGDVVSIGGRCR